MKKYYTYGSVVGRGERHYVFACCKEYGFGIGCYANIPAYGLFYYNMTGNGKANYEINLLKTELDMEQIICRKCLLPFFYIEQIAALKSVFLLSGDKGINNYIENLIIVKSESFN